MSDNEIIDIKSAKERFMGNFGLFSKFLYQFPEKSLFSELMDNLELKDVKKAFVTAHTMKGIVGNLSLKLIEKPLYDVVEVLRAGEMPDEKMISNLKEKYEITVKEIESLKENGEMLF